jgi:hemolysin activation/secretion protein
MLIASRSSKVSVIFSVGFLLMSSTAMAAPAALPSSVDAGRVQSDMKQQMQPSAISTPEDVSSTPEVQAPAGAEKVTLVLKGVIVEGASKISKDKIAAAYQSDLNKKITLADVYKIANKITGVYRDNGYLLSRAIVPKQQIHDGIVHIQVIEGHVSGYTIEGVGPGGIHDQVKAYADKLVSTGTLNSQNLERYLLLMNDLPGVKVRSVLVPSKTVFGGTDMKLIVEQRKFQGTAGVDDYGNKYIGPYRYTVSGQANSLFNSTDQLNGAVLLSPDSGELQYYTGSYTQNIGNEGTKVGVNATYVQTNPTLPDSLGGALNPEGESYSFGATVSHPFIRSRDLNVNGGAAFDITRNETEYDDPAFSPLETTDSQRIARLNGQITYLDNYAGYNVSNVVVSQGIEIFGSSKKGDAGLSRAAGDPGFTKVNADISRLQHIYGDLTGLFAMTGQYSAESLLSSEQFGFGGNQFGRGYDYSEITGDSGLAAKAELGYTINTQRKYLDSYQPYVFYDIGKVWNRSPAAGQPVQESGASAGIGTRLTFTQSLLGDVFIAKPLTRDVASRGDHGDDYRFKFALTKNF